MSNKHVHVGTRLSAILLAIMAVISFAVSNSLNHSYWWLAHTYQVIEKVKEINLKLVKCQSDNRGYVITQDQDFLINYQDYSDRIFPEIDNLGKFTSDNPIQQSNIKSLKELVGAKLGRIRKDISLVDNGQVEDAINHIKTGEGETIMRKVQSNIDDIIKEEYRLLSLRAENVEENYKYVAYGIPALIMLSLAMLIVTSKLGY